MKTPTTKLKLSLCALIASLSFGGTAAFAQTTTHATSSAHNADRNNMMVTVQIMKHLCKSGIKNIQDFRALEAGRDPVAALANTVLNCPTTGLPGDESVAGTVASPRMTYDFTVEGDQRESKMLSSNGIFMQHKLSEADINKDVDGNGTISSSTALDISHYEIGQIMARNGRVEVTESAPPAGFHFGTIRFTPPILDNNNDEESLVNTNENQGRFKLDMTNDMDKTVMVHVYNFRNQNEATEGRSGIISRINLLQQQIQSLSTQIQTLLSQLR